jgi:hypothetical protein
VAQVGLAQIVLAQAILAPLIFDGAWRRAIRCGAVAHRGLFC